MRATFEVPPSMVGDAPALREYVQQQAAARGWRVTADAPISTRVVVQHPIFLDPDNGPTRQAFADVEVLGS